jgi:hypothetical protein
MSAVKVRSTNQLSSALVAIAFGAICKLLLKIASPHTLKNWDTNAGNVEGLNRF